MSHRPRAPMSGFTLLEMIVVIGIFAIFAAMAYGGLDTVLRARAKLDEGTQRTADFDRAYLRMRNDFQNAQARPTRDSNGQAEAALLFDSYSRRVEFTRGGWVNLLSLPRSTLERVSYRLEDKPEEGSTAKPSLDDRRLVRRSWLLLDRGPRAEPIELTLLAHVKDMKFRFLDATGNWSEGWPTSQPVATPGGTSVSSTLPGAVEIKLTANDWGELRFVFRVGAEGSSKLADIAKLAPPVQGGSTGGATGNSTGTTTGTAGGTAGGNGNGGNGNGGGGGTTAGGNTGR